MNRPKNQFLTAPSRTLFHSGRSAAPGQDSAALLTRAVFSWQTNFDVAESTHKFQDKVQENYDKKLKSLSGKIKAFEAQNKDQEQIKAELQKEKIKLLQEAINQALRDLKINKTDGKPVTYLEVTNDPDFGSRIEAIYKTYEAKVEADVDKAVDDYFTQRGIASGKIKAALTAIPAATAPIDFNSPNPEILALQELRAAREQTLDTSKKNRTELLQNESMRYRTTAAKIDELTSPNGGKIDDYDDGWNPLSKVTDENSPTRFRLNGYLYANYIFAGGNEQGMQAVNAGIEKPYKLYHSTFGDSIFTTKNLDSDMGLEAFFKTVKEFSNFDRPLGMMAGLMKLADDNLKDPAEHQRYSEYLLGKFAELKTGPASNNEEKQLEFLFGIKSRAEFLHIDPNWKNALDAADIMTDPTRDDSKITDYPGLLGSNKDNPTRHQLTGYLYSVYLFNSKNTGNMRGEFERAAKIYDDSGFVDKDFTQDDLEKDPEGKKDRFGLGSYLREAENMTKFDKVKGVIAGLLKQSDSIANPEDKARYKKELSDKFALLTKTEGEDNQLMLLSTVIPYVEHAYENPERLRIDILDLMIKASQQHNQFKFSPALLSVFDKSAKTLTAKEYEAKAAEAHTEIENFIKGRSDEAMENLRYKYKVLVENNSKLAKPLYGPADLNPLRLAIEDSDKKFNEARLVNRTSEFRPSVEDKYLEKLTNAEKIYLDRGTELDTKLQAVKDSGSTTPITKAPTGSDAIEGGGSSSGSGNGGNEDAPEKLVDSDPYTANWAKGERVTPVMGNYTGELLVNSTDPKEKVIGYNYKGDRIATLDNNTEVTRTAKDAEQPARKIENLNFVRVTYKGKKMWIPEEQLFQKEEKAAVQSANEQPKEPIANPEFTPPLLEKSDKFTAAWANAEKRDTEMMLKQGVFLTKSTVIDGKINIRNPQGEIIDAIPPQTLLLRTAKDVNEKALRVLTVDFIQITYNGVPAWIAENTVEPEPVKPSA